jgi:hypothetical protein
MYPQVSLANGPLPRRAKLASLRLKSLKRPILLLSKILLGPSPASCPPFFDWVSISFCSQ